MFFCLETLGLILDVFVLVLHLNTWIICYEETYQFALAFLNMSIFCLSCRISVLPSIAEWLMGQSSRRPPMKPWSRHGTGVAFVGVFGLMVKQKNGTEFLWIFQKPSDLSLIQMHMTSLDLHKLFEYIFEDVYFFVKGVSTRVPKVLSPGLSWVESWGLNGGYSYWTYWERFVACLGDLWDGMPRVQTIKTFYVVEASSYSVQSSWAIPFCHGWFFMINDLMYLQKNKVGSWECNWTCFLTYIRLLP